MRNQEFKAQGRKYQVLSNFGVCCMELGGGRLKVVRFHACVRSFRSVAGNTLIVVAPVHQGTA